MDPLQISIAANIILFMIVASTLAIIKVGVINNKRLSEDNIRLFTRTSVVEHQLLSYQRSPLSITTTKLKLDVKTTSLLHLALNNTNENEARAAALQVCKRIKKTL